MPAKGKNFPIAGVSCLNHIFRGFAGTELFIHGGDGFHFCVSQLEIKKIQIALNAFCVERFGNDGDSPLNQPAQANLCGGFTIFLSNGG